MTDFNVTRHGMNLFMFEPRTDAAEKWVAEHVELEPWQSIGAAFVVDARFAAGLADALLEEGFIVQ